KKAFETVGTDQWKDLPPTADMRIVAPLIERAQEQLRQRGAWVTARGGDAEKDLGCRSLREQLAQLTMVYLLSDLDRRIDVSETSLDNLPLPEPRTWRE